MEQHGVYVAPGHWFDLEDVYFRVGFGWPTIDELKYRPETKERSGRVYKPWGV